MSREEYTGGVSDMKDNPWLASEDIDGLGDIKVTIEGVFKNTDVMMDGGKKEAQLFSLKFVGKDKEMILNATNRKTLSAAFGANTKNWKNKEVILYVQGGVRNPKGGEPVKGLRLRANTENPFKGEE